MTILSAFSARAHYFLSARAQLSQSAHATFSARTRNFLSARTQLSVRTRAEKILRARWALTVCGNLKSL
jgi:hypothetical protein